MPHKIVWEEEFMAILWVTISHLPHIVLLGVIAASAAFIIKRLRSS